MSSPEPPRPPLEIGRVYTDQELADYFDFDPHYLRSAGGMISVPSKNALLLMTHGKKEASFDYGDYRVGNTLHYAGRGQTGDQQLIGQNRDVAENRRELYVFEYVAKFNRRFLGNATCHGYRWETARDRKGDERRILRFALELLNAPAFPAERSETRPPDRKKGLISRPFDENRPPAAPAPGESISTPEQRAQLLEKRNTEHHRLLVALKHALEESGWTDIEEIPSSIDLWARRNGHRVIFEAKTLNRKDEITQVRCGLAQLLEYRFKHGESEDGLCLVVNAPLSRERVQLLNALGIGVLVLAGSKFTAYGVQAESILKGCSSESTT